MSGRAFTSSERRNLETHVLIAAAVFRITVDQLEMSSVFGQPVKCDPRRMHTQPQVGCYECERKIDECMRHPCTGPAPEKEPSS